MSEKIALIIPANIWFCPFIKIYTNLFDEWKIPYDIIFWNKGHSSEETGICFKAKPGNNPLSKLISYYRYSNFVKTNISKFDYSKLIAFTSQVGVFCSKYLEKNYKGKYIFDFRDLSIEQSTIFKHSFNRLLKNSYANVISSPGFKKCLPSEYEYILSHNFDISEVEKHLIITGVNIPQDPVDILTIGGIRDYCSNAPLMDSVGNNPGFRLRFIGRGPSAMALKEHSLDKGFKNVFFEGYYKKEDEPKYINEASFLNIYYPDVITHKTALSNRFYNSLIYRKPMIVTKGQIQGDYCERYNLGIAVENITELPNQVNNWLVQNNFNEYESRCIELLKEFIKDYSIFKEMLKSFILRG